MSDVYTHAQMPRKTLAILKPQETLQQIKTAEMPSRQDCSYDTAFIVYSLYLVAHQQSAHSQLEEPDRDISNDNETDRA